MVALVPKMALNSVALVPNSGVKMVVLVTDSLSIWGNNEAERLLGLIVSPDR